MGNLKKFIPAILTGLTIPIVIFYSSKVSGSAAEAVSMCLQVIIPSMFPLMFLGMLLCNYWKDIRIPFLDPLCCATGIPKNGQSIILLAFLGGYPVGAQAVTSAYNDGLLNKKQAHRLLGFCNNAGPSFIFGLIGSMFRDKASVLLLWLIHICSAVIVGYILPDKDARSQKGTISKKDQLTGILSTSIRVTSVICGWIIIFKILINFINSLIVDTPQVVRVVLFGLLELSNGCVLLPTIAQDSVRFIVTSGLISAGGICVAMQTKAVVGSIGLGMYFPGKIIQLCISVLLSSIVAPFLYNESISLYPIIVSIIIGLVILTILKRKKL